MFHHVPDAQPSVSSVSLVNYKQESTFLQEFNDTDVLMRYVSIYFIESSAPFKPFVTIEPRQACAIESAARANRRKKIVVLFASWHEPSEQLKFPELRLLSKFPNIHFRWLNLKPFVQGTPVEDVIQPDALHARANGAEFLSEVLRIVLLYRFGGIYLDMDVVTLKTLDFYNPNFFGAESERLAGTSVIGLERLGFGRIFAERCLNNFKNFDDGGNKFRNGSMMITYGVVEACETYALDDVVQKGCGGLLEVFSRNFFNPFDETNVSIMFDPRRLSEAKQILANAMVVHMLHRTSKKMRSNGGGETGYSMIAKTYCPSVYNENKKEF